MMLVLMGCASTKKSPNVDGSTMEKAIKANSVPEEYNIVRERCIDCKMKGQALLSGKGGKFYDRLTLVNPQGQEVNYYFDITSFYGKW